MDPSAVVTVTTLVTKHPVVAVYVIIVVPVETPDTTPVPPTVAIDASSDIQVPPVKVFANNKLPPTTVKLPPVIDGGLLLTVTFFSDRQPFESV
jgi:hypothetical protein